MDWITQLLLGALIGELILGRRLGNRALAWGGFLGVLPDLDVLFYPFLDTARCLAWHRGPSHSLLIMGLGAYGIARGLEKIWKHDQITRIEAGRLVLTVWAVHLFADCLTVKGAAVLWPFYRQRIAFDGLHSVDYLFVLPLVTALLWILVSPKQSSTKKTRSKKAKPNAIAMSKRRKICLWGLGLGAGYSFFALGMKTLAASGFEADLLRRGTTYQRIMESPIPHNPLFWRAIVDRDDEFWVGYRSVFEFHTTPVRWTIYPKGKSALAEVADMREAKSLLHFTDGWWISRPHAKGAWLGDLREPEVRIWGRKKGMVDSRLADSWLISTDGTGDSLRTIIPDQEKDDASDHWQRVIRRTFGNRENWEANPRLAGHPGSLPEALGVKE